MKEALVVMAEAPRPGVMKTKLIGATPEMMPNPMTAEQAAELHANFLSDTFTLMESIQEERDQLQLVLCYAPEGDEELFETVEREGSLMIPQRGHTGSERVQNCFADVFALGFDVVAIITADNPALPGEHVFDAFEILADEEATEDDLVIGPTEQAGYYLLGARKLHTGLFADAAARGNDLPAAAEAAGLNLFLLPAWYSVETVDDFARLKQEMDDDRSVAKFTRKFLQQLPEA